MRGHARGRYAAPHDMIVPGQEPRPPITRNFGEYAFLALSRNVVNYKMKT
jgi:hypothetical protein